LPPFHCCVEGTTPRFSLGPIVMEHSAIPATLSFSRHLPLCVFFPSFFLRTPQHDARPDRHCPCSLLPPFSNEADSHFLKKTPMVDFSYPCFSPRGRTNEMIFSPPPFEDTFFLLSLWLLFPSIISLFPRPRPLPAYHLPNAKKLLAFSAGLLRFARAISPFLSSPSFPFCQPAAVVFGKFSRVDVSRLASMLAPPGDI